MHAEQSVVSILEILSFFFKVVCSYMWLVLLLGYGRVCLRLVESHYWSVFPQSVVHTTFPFTTYSVRLDFVQI